MGKFNLKPTPVKVIIPAILVISLIIVTFYGKAIMSDHPTCETKEVYLKIQEARMLNDTSAPIWKEINDSMNYIKSKGDYWEKIEGVTIYYSVITYLNPFSENVDVDVPPIQNLLSQEQADCYIETVNNMKASGDLESFFDVKFEFNPYYSFKNLAINSIVLIIESYLLICLIEFIIKSLKRKK